MLQSYLGHLPRVDASAYIHPAAVLIGQVEIGAEVSVWPNTTLRGDDGRIVIGARSSVQDGTVIHTTEDLSEVVVGEQVTIGHNVTLHGARVGSNCIVGMGSILLDNATIGEYCLIGAGSLITQNVEIPPYSLVFGSPAKVIRKVNEKELEWIAYSWQRYVEQCKIYRDKGEG